MKKLFFALFAVVLLLGLALSSQQSLAASKSVTICNANIGSDGKPLIWETRVLLLASDKRRVISANVIKTDQTANVATVCKNAPALPSGMTYQNYATVSLTSDGASYVAWATSCADPTYDITTSVLDISCHPQGYNGSNPTMYAACDRIVKANAGGVNGTINLNQVCPSDNYCATNGFLWSPASVNDAPPYCKGQCVVGCFGSGNAPYAQNATNLTTIYDPYCATAQSDALHPSCEPKLTSTTKCDTPTATTPTSSITFNWTDYNTVGSVRYPADGSYRYSLKYCDHTQYPTDCKSHLTTKSSLSGLTYTATGLVPGHVYWWWVTVDNDSNYHWYTSVPFTSRSPHQYIIPGYPINAPTEDATASTTTAATCPTNCTPKKCSSVQVCGQIDDGCNGKVTCGTCVDGKVCGTDNTCSCPTGQKLPHLACGTNGTCAKVNTCGVDSCNPENSSCVASTISFVIGLDAIGTTGDQPNPTDYTAKPGRAEGSNLNPIHKTRNLSVLLTSVSNSTQTVTGTMTYNGTAGDANYGKFVASLTLPQSFVTGDYTLAVTTDTHLTKKVPGFKHIVAGQNNVITTSANPLNLIAGDITKDNALSATDYNILISCDIYSVDRSTCNSNSTYLELSDLDDNGKVDEFDYNLFLREFSIQNGD